MFACMLTSKPCSEATDIGDRLSLVSDFGEIYLNETVRVGDLRINAEI